MRWEIKPDPEHGQRIAKRRFALFPTRVFETNDHRIWVWLEVYYAMKIWIGQYWDWCIIGGEKAKVTKQYKQDWEERMRNQKGLI